MMNWRVSGLDRYTLISTSDAHSPYPFRLGREAVVLDLKHVTFDEVTDAIENKDLGRLLMTIEVPPAYGKGASQTRPALRHITGRDTENAAWGLYLQRRQEK